MDKNIFITKDGLKQFNSILNRLKYNENRYEYRNTRVSYGIILIIKKKNSISFFLLQRPCTNEYQEFVTGSYKNKSLYNIFSLMTKEERFRVKTQSFGKLYSDIYGSFKKKDRRRKYSINRYFGIEREIENLLNITECQREELPWFFPKGKPKQGETCIQAALREFSEEANFFPRDIKFLEGTLEDYYTGTNDKNYKNIYYVGVTEVEYLPRKRKLSELMWKPPMISYEASGAQWVNIKSLEDIQNLDIINDRLKTLMTQVFESAQFI